MSLESLTLFHIAVPLKKVVRHASFERSSSENLVVRATLADGTTGYGEGVPRTYVTGESIDSAFEMLSRHDWAAMIGAPHDYSELVARLTDLEIPEIENDPRGMAGNAARCALELALLDAYGRRFGQSVGEAVALAQFEGLERRPPARVRYSGAITAESPRGEVVSALKMRLYGFHQVKIKVGAPGHDDRRGLARMRRILGNRIDVRLDANEAFGADEVVERVRELLFCRPSALEQPVPHAQVDCLAELKGRLGVPIMLDESLCGYPDAVQAIERGTADILNVRLSKCGGILPSLRIIALASRSGKGVQLGCHPGETSILSAAGRQVACRLAGLRYLEGSYDRHILAQNLAATDLTFGYGGRARPLAGPGLGLGVDPDRLEAMTIARRELSYA